MQKHRCQSICADANFCVTGSFCQGQLSDKRRNIGCSLVVQLLLDWERRDQFVVALESIAEGVLASAGAGHVRWSHVSCVWEENRQDVQA